MSSCFVAAPGAHSFYRRLQCFLARHAGLYLKTLRWTGRGSLEKKVYLSLIEPGDVVFDVGANEGHFTLLFSDLVGAAGEVHAFEPVLPTFDRLRRFVVHNQRFDNVFANNHACSAVPGAVTMHMPDDDSGQASMKFHQHGSWVQGAKLAHFTAFAIKLDDYALGQAAAHVDFVKCDVEGAELLALKGMSKRLVCCRPLLFLEVCPHWMESFDYRPDDLITFLKSIGYDDFFLVTDRIARLVEASAALARVGENDSVNLLCAVAGRHASRLQRLHQI